MTVTTEATMIDLDQFTAKHDIREYLAVAFRHEGYLWATNGHLMVRVPDDGRPHVGDADEAQAKLPGVWPVMWPQEWFRIASEIPPADMSECYACGGAKRAQCDMGHWHPCDACDATGEVAERVAVGLLGACVADAYLRQVNALPGAAWALAPTPPAMAAPPEYFCAQGDGWQAIVMPMRSDPEVTLEAERLA